MLSASCPYRFAEHARAAQGTEAPCATLCLPCLQAAPVWRLVPEVGGREGKIRSAQQTYSMHYARIGAPFLCWGPLKWLPSLKCSGVSASRQDKNLLRPEAQGLKGSSAILHNLLPVLGVTSGSPQRLWRGVSCALHGDILARSTLLQAMRPGDIPPGVWRLKVSSQSGFPCVSRRIGRKGSGCWWLVSFAAAGWLLGRI